MNGDITRKQRSRFFATNVAAFAFIFFLLGFITLQILNQSAYRETDLSLEKINFDSRTVQLEIQRYQQGDPFLNPTQTEQNRTNMEQPLMEPSNDRFNTQVILWSKNGEILNKTAIGGRFNQIKELKMDTKNLNTIQNIELNEDSGSSALSFRSITKKAETNQDGVAYIQILENTNQIKNSLATFRTIMILCMIVFWILSIGISYYLSSLSMRPIILSWRRQKEFVENASHELRTPLTIIQNSLEHLFTKPNHTIIEESESIAQALSETRRLTGLTSDLLTIARNDSDQQLLSKQMINTQEYIEQLVKPFQEMAIIDGKEFILHNDATLEVPIDEKKIHQVLVILLDNALKYTNPEDKIILDSSVNHKEWLIHVKNTGPSISEEDQARIFDRFYREDQSRAKETGGYGLGLAIAKQVIEQHHGQISVSNYLPQGVDFKVQLPLKPKK
ncbi:HAMP domain-containing histidine kinase [Enterococcus faecium]|nr:HAMP domain-containing histidine kinase [Enterococcus faecium]MBJ1117081.1 HAMP domain-containing histidine kinase [Enterococcus faecium]MBK1160562.1 HAMP domain-containing histidine kinase [Enterococcus faecium]